MTTAVLTPFTAGNAIELAGTWRKRLLPVGEIRYKDRVLRFTRQYLQTLADAFADGAYDQVPFQLAGADNGHTNAVERFAGRIVGADVESDGLWVTVQPTDRGEAILQENPMLGVSARIVESYDRADGKFYPAAIQHVLATHDPRITGLGGWQAVEASNSGQVVIDLSGCQWAGELQFSAYDVADATPQEIAAMDQVMAEMAEQDAEAGQYGLDPEEWAAMIYDGEAALANYAAGIELAEGDTLTVLPDGRIVCPGCGTACEPDAQFCPGCGTAVQDPAAFRQPGQPGGSTAFSGDDFSQRAWELAGQAADAMYPGLADLSQSIELSQQQAFGNEQLRRQQDAPRPAGRAGRTAQPTTEDRLADAYSRIATGSYLPGDRFAFGNSSQRDITLSNLRESQDFANLTADSQLLDGALPCGALDMWGRCAERYHSADCSGLSDTELALALKEAGVYAAVAEFPIDGGEPYGDSGSYADHIEAATGQRMSHRDGLFETGATKRELYQPVRRAVYADPSADPGDPDNPLYEPAFATRAVVSEVIRQNSHLQPRQRPDRLTAIADFALRTGHMPKRIAELDTTGRETMAERRDRVSTAGGMHQAEGTEALCGSLPGYSR